MRPGREEEFANRILQTKIEASKRGFDCLFVISLAPRRVGDLLYLANHQPMMPGVVRRYSFRGRGYSVMILPIKGDSCIISSTPFFENDIYIKNTRYSNNIIDEIGKVTRELMIDKGDIGIVGMDVISAALFLDLQKELYQAKFYHADDIVMNLRTVKSPWELKIMREGAEIADDVAIKLREFLRVGLSELEVYDFITGALKKHGVSGAFATCQSGKRSEAPYDFIPASDKIIEDGDMVHMEINGNIEGYKIDICRSTVVGTISSQQRNILEITLKMLEKSFEATRPGIVAEDLEKITGDIAYANGFYKNHTNAYGGPGTYLAHSLGLGTDEPPIIAKGDKTILVPGMVITLEPGLYNTGFGGCRIEDEVLVTASGSETLNKCERKWWS